MNTNITNLNYKFTLPLRPSKKQQKANTSTQIKRINKNNKRTSTNCINVNTIRYLEPSHISGRKKPDPKAWVEERRNLCRLCFHWIILEITEKIRVFELWIFVFFKSSRWMHKVNISIENLSFSIRWTVEMWWHIKTFEYCVIKYCILNLFLTLSSFLNTFVKDNKKYF